MDTERLSSMSKLKVPSLSHVPKVSIGLPVYNGQSFIHEALDSLLAQSFIDFELIISDNASTDKTSEICLEYAQRDCRILYIRQRFNIGPVENFKFVLDRSVGAYFLWAAADDLRHPEFLKTANSILDRHLEIGLVFSNMELKDLGSGAKIDYLFSHASTTNKFVNVLFRISRPCSSLIYGLFRKTCVREMQIDCFDYFDIYFGLWFQLRFSIAVIPLCMYTAGTKSNRVPYGLTEKYVNPYQYLVNSNALLWAELKPPASIILLMLNIYYAFKASLAHNRQIRSSNSV